MWGRGRVGEGGERKLNIVRNAKKWKKKVRVMSEFFFK